MVQDEALNTTISISCQMAKTAADMIEKVLRDLIEALDSLIFGDKNNQKQINDNFAVKDKDKKVKIGKMKFEELSEKGQTDWVDISNRDEFKKISKMCNKYGVNYSVIKDKHSNKYTIFFQARDVNIIQKFAQNAHAELTADKAGQENSKENTREAAENTKENTREAAENTKESESDKREKELDKREENLEKREKTVEKVEEMQGKQAEKLYEKEKKLNSEYNLHSESEQAPDRGKVRETMGEEEREKEEPVKAAETETKMPTVFSEPVRSTDDVKKEKAKEEKGSDIASGDEKSDKNPLSKDYDINQKFSTQDLWAAAEKQSYSDYRESYLDNASKLDGAKGGFDNVMEKVKSKISLRDMKAEKAELDKSNMDRPAKTPSLNKNAELAME